MTRKTYILLDPAAEWLSSRPMRTVLLVVAIISAPAIIWQYMTYGTVFITGAWQWNIDLFIITTQMLLAYWLFTLGVFIGIQVGERS